MTIILGFAAGYILAYLYERVMLAVGKKIKKKTLIIAGYKLHHSIYGLILIVISLFTQPTLLLISLGVGIIAQHYFTGDGLVFITKINKDQEWSKNTYYN